jgi:CRISPR-associated endonuclease Csn1
MWIVKSIILKQGVTMSYVLGLDLGPNSIGWACIDNNNKRAIDMGVRIFQEGVNRAPTGKESSKNEVRRLKRQSRRQYERARQRRENLVSVLKRNAMYPDTPEGEKDFFSWNPYELRRRALDDKLSLLETGRVLFHINQRRGFKSSRKRQGDAKEDSTLYVETGELEAKIKAAGCRTLGEYLAGLNPMEQRIRDNYTLRKWYEDEFDAIWTVQGGHYAELTDTLKDEIRNRIIFYQRPLKSVARFIGNCSLEPVRTVKYIDKKGKERTILKGEKRCRKDSFEFQRYRIFEQINRLKYIGEDGVERLFFKRKDDKGKFVEFDEETRNLRDRLIAELEKSAECKYDKARKLLKLPEGTRFNLEGEGEAKLIGDRTGAELAKVFDRKKWSSMTAEQKEKVYQVYIFASDEEWLLRYAKGKEKEQWGLDDKRAEKILKINLESGYAAYSKKAILKLLLHLEAGFALSDAIEMAGYGKGKKSEYGENPLKDLRNPLVAQTLYELLRFLPKLEKVHGRPDEIRVELARELKVSSEKRGKMTKDNFKRRAENERVSGKLIEYEIQPNHDAVQRYKLWEECKGICPYTGRSISVDALFKTNEFQVEHILPYSRSLDDSFMNKTLCHTGENKIKGNHTPYEEYGSTAAKWDEILMRVKHFPYSKRERFTMKELPDDFISRQLNDTAYISREAKSLLESKDIKGMDYKVSVSMGRATAQLRYLWGLNNVLGGGAEGVKNREDHRHHAIDAVVVALTDIKTLESLQWYYKHGKTPTERRFPAPWDNFRSDIEGLAGRILVSHRVNKRVRGQLHEETYYGSTGLKKDKKMSIYVVRKKLEDLTPDMLESIRDEEVRKIIIDALEANGISRKDKNGIKNYFKNNPVFMKCAKGLKIPINKVRTIKVAGNMIPLPGRDDDKTFVEPGNNHHAVFYRYIDKNGKPRYDAEVCTLFEAVRRLKKGEAVIKRRLCEGREFLVSLKINELVLISDDGLIDASRIFDDREAISRRLFRVQKISDKITLRLHRHALTDDVNVVESAIKKFAGEIGSGRALKVKIDRLGRLDRAND